VATYTQKYGLKKPEATDTSEIIADLNYNWDLLDDALGQKPDLGANNQSINLFRALNQQIDTRSLELVYDTNDGNLTTVYEKDGETTVKTTTLEYDLNGNLSTVTEQVAGRTITTTLSYDTNGNLTGITRQVS
jgi:YD repeat-containing protein